MEFKVGNTLLKVHGSRKGSSLRGWSSAGPSQAVDTEYSRGYESVGKEEFS
jgi:hypothetical protein